MLALLRHSPASLAPRKNDKDNDDDIPQLVPLHSNNTTVSQGSVATSDNIPTRNEPTRAHDEDVDIILPATPTPPSNYRGAINIDKPSSRLRQNLPRPDYREVDAVNKAAEITDEPTTVAAALTSADRRLYLLGIQKEIAGIRDQQTWTHLEHDGNSIIATKNAFGCRLLFKIKQADDGSRKAKARLVAKGFAQVPGRDFDPSNTYASVVHNDSLFILIHIFAHRDMEIQAFDIQQAYLQADVTNKSLLMKIPKEYTPFLTDSFLSTNIADMDDDTLDKYIDKILHASRSNAPLTVRLRKALYGLRQSGAEWQKTFREFLSSIGFKPMQFDSAVYIKHIGNCMIIIPTHVDDILIAADKISHIQDVARELTSRFGPLHELGEIASYLGMTYTRDRANRRIHISQPDFAEKIVNTTIDTNMKIKLTPLNPLVNMRTAATHECPPSWKTVGLMRYLTDHTRADLLFAMSQHSAIAANPGKIHMEQLMETAQYIHGTKELGLWLGGKEPPILFGYADASFRIDDDSKSHRGHCLFLNRSSGAIINESKKCDIIDHSVCSVETVSTSMAVKDFQWARDFLEELTYPQPTFSPLFIDNSCTIDNVRASKISKASRANTLRINHIREQEQLGNVKVFFVRSEHNIADLHTKALGKGVFQTHRAKLLGYSSSFPTLYKSDDDYAPLRKVFDVDM